MDNKNSQLLMCAETAKIMNQQASAVLSLWLESLPATEDGCEESNLVAAVLSLVDRVTEQLEKAEGFRDA